MRRFHTIGAVAVLISLVAGSARGTWYRPYYAPLNLGTCGGTSVSPCAINNLGMVAGEGATSGTTPGYAFRTAPNQPINPTTDMLPTLGGSYTNQGFGINDAGVVVGSSYLPDNSYHAYLYSSGTALQDLGTLGGNWSVAYGVNNNAAVVGYSPITGNSPVHAFLYSSGSLQDLGTIGTSTNPCYGRGINNNGDITGYGYTNTGAGPHAFLHTGPGPLSPADDLGVIGSGTASYGLAINVNRQVAGYAPTNGTSNNHAILYSGGTMQDLGTLGGTNAFAYGINDSGAVVGYSLLSDNTTYHAFVSNSGGAMLDLNSVIPAAVQANWILTGTFAINDSGQIAGWGKYNGASAGWLVTPALPGDANLDRTVDISDLNKVLTNFDKTGMTWDQGDFDGNGAVDIADLNKVLTNFDKTAGTSFGGVKAVPEPGALALLIVGLVALATGKAGLGIVCKVSVS
jgi:probable HAF family extracellular repeat protein